MPFVTIISSPGLILECTERQLANLKYAAEWWKKIHPDSVNDLSTWYCGSQACFLGHCALNARFQSAGLHHNLWRAPSLKHPGHGRVLTGLEACDFLFGAEDFGHQARIPRLDDHLAIGFHGHSLVTARLAFGIKHHRIIPEQ